MSNTALPPVYFGRIDANWNTETRRLLWEKGYFAVMFDNDGKVDPDSIAKATELRARDPKSEWFREAGYTTRYGVEAIERMRKAVTDSALVFVDFRGIDDEYSVLIGKAAGPLDIVDVTETYTKGSRKGQTGTSHYKFFRVIDAKRMKLDPVLAALRPRQATFVNWKAGQKRVVAAYRGERLPAEVGSLTPGQLEAVCFEYLRSQERSLKLMLPLGRTLPDVDILGWVPGLGTLAAQVTHSTSRKGKVLNKAIRLSKSPDINSYIMFAGRDALDGARKSADWPDEVQPVAIEEAFKQVLDGSPDFIEAML